MFKLMVIYAIKGIIVQYFDKRFNVIRSNIKIDSREIRVRERFFSNRSSNNIVHTIIYSDNERLYFTSR